MKLQGPRRAVAVASAALALSTLSIGFLAPSASAASGLGFATGQKAQTFYDDAVDKVTVCDNAKDGHGAIGWIEIQQSDGSYKKFPRVYAGGGLNDCTSATQDVIRERSNVKVVACMVDGRNGTPFGCGQRTVKG